MVCMRQYTVSLLLALHVISSTLIPVRAEEETRECREQEFKDRFGNCKPCKKCDAGQELSKECGFGYGEDAQCVPCRSSRFKEDRNLQKCKPCLDCGLINRFQKSNCSSTSNAVCGDCLPGYYRKTKLSGFQDMECMPCGDLLPSYEPHCNERVNLVPLLSVVTSPQDMALAGIICSALATVLLALLVLCVIYCKRQLLESKLCAASLRSQDCPFSGAELSYLDPHDFTQKPCCQCHLGPGHTCGPVHLIPSLCCDESCSLDGSQDISPFQSQMSLSDGRPQSKHQGGTPLKQFLCPANMNQGEKGSSTQSGENTDCFCKDSCKMREIFKTPQSFRLLQCNAEPVERLKGKENEVKGCRSRENSTIRDSYSEAVTDLLSPKLHSSSQEG